MARKPKPSARRNRNDSAATPAARRTEPEWQTENQSLQTPGRVRWFSAHEYTTSEDTLRTPKAEDKPGIGAPSARQEPNALPNEDETLAPDRASPPPADQSHERPSPSRRRASTRPRRDAAARGRRGRKAR